MRPPARAPASTQGGILQGALHPHPGVRGGRRSHPLVAKMPAPPRGSVSFLSGCPAPPPHPTFLSAPAPTVPARPPFPPRPRRELSLIIN